MATLESRLAKLEATRAQHRPDDPWRVAMKRLFDALTKALPDDKGPDFLTGNMVVRELSAYRSSFTKIMDLADRITAGELSEEDRLLLEGLPHDALECLDMTAPELVTMLARVRRMY